MYTGVYFTYMLACINPVDTIPRKFQQAGNGKECAQKRENSNLERWHYAASRIDAHSHIQKSANSHMVTTMATTEVSTDRSLYECLYIRVWAYLWDVCSDLETY